MLKEYYFELYDAEAFSLNPYFNGTCSKRKLAPCVNHDTGECLNPYFNGTCSKRDKIIFFFIPEAKS